MKWSENAANETCFVLPAFTWEMKWDERMHGWMNEWFDNGIFVKLLLNIPIVNLKRKNRN